MTVYMPKNIDNHREAGLSGGNNQGMPLTGTSLSPFSTDKFRHTNKNDVSKSSETARVFDVLGGETKTNKLWD